MDASTISGHGMVLSGCGTIRREPSHRPVAVIRCSMTLPRANYDSLVVAAALLAQAKRVAAATGFQLDEVPLTGGGSDGNFTAALGVPTLDGLGAEGDGAHTLDEHILISSLPQRLRFWHGLLRDLAWIPAEAQS